MNTEIIDKCLADADRRLKEYNDKVKYYDNLIARRLNRNKKYHIEKGIICQYFLKAIEWVEVEKLIYLNFKTSNEELFNRLYERYVEINRVLIVLTSELFGLMLRHEFNEFYEYSAFSDTIMGRMYYVKELCKAGSNGLKLEDIN